MTLRTLNYGNYGIFLIMGNAGFCPSTVSRTKKSPRLNPFSEHVCSQTCSRESGKLNAARFVIHVILVVWVYKSCRGMATSAAQSCQHGTPHMQMATPNRISLVKQLRNLVFFRATFGRARRMRWGARRPPRPDDSQLALPSNSKTSSGNAPEYQPAAHISISLCREVYPP